MAHEIILHHYWTSPFSEKVRLVFGIKDIKWRSVEIPNMMPKPDLMPLTGGYRKTPVMQIGADIYCDTQIIIRELERRYPTPALISEPGLSYAVGLWSDRPFFQATVPLIFGEVGPMIPEAFKKDREQMFPERPFDHVAMKAAIPIFKDQYRGHAGLLEAQLKDGRKFLCGDEPAIEDVHGVLNVWFLKNFYAPTADALLKEFPLVAAWFERLKGIGHGKYEPMTSQEALAVARNSTSEAVPLADPHDPNGRKPGDRVKVSADDYGRDPVAGELVYSNAQEIAIKRSDPQTGDIVVHFPRLGFNVLPG
jgi:glutathione S-transferase